MSNNDHNDERGFCGGQHRQQVETWRAQQLSSEEVKLTIYRAFIENFDPMRKSDCRAQRARKQ